jgi:hypothetical protein
MKEAKAKKKKRVLQFCSDCYKKRIFAKDLEFVVFDSRHVYGRSCDICGMCKWKAWQPRTLESNY